jgi:hypothetical protein
MERRRKKKKPTRKGVHKFWRGLVSKIPPFFFVSGKWNTKNRT